MRKAVQVLTVLLSFGIAFYAVHEKEQVQINFPLGNITVTPYSNDRPALGVYTFPTPGTNQ